MGNLFNLIPLNIRLSIYAGIVVIALGGIGYVSYMVHNYDKLKKDNVALQNQVSLQEGYLTKLLADQKTIAKGKTDAIKHIKETHSTDRTPAALLDTINSLPDYGTPAP